MFHLDVVNPTVIEEDVQSTPPSTREDPELAQVTSQSEDDALLPTTPQPGDYEEYEDGRLNTDVPPSTDHSEVEERTSADLATTAYGENNHEQISTTEVS